MASRAVGNIRFAPSKCAPSAGKVEAVHAIERLRWVAQDCWAPAEEVAADAAFALAEVAEEEPSALLPSCRRLLERHPWCGPLWWVAAHLLASPDPAAEAERRAGQLLGDPTEEILAVELVTAGRAVRRGSLADLVGAEVAVVQVEAVSVGAMAVDADQRGMLLAARELDLPVWVVAGVGRVLPRGLWQSMVDRSGGGRGGRAAAAAGSVPRAPSTARSHLSTLEGVVKVVGPNGSRSVESALSAATCPEPAELTGDRGW